MQECGDDARTAKNDGATAVFVASQNGQTETVRALVLECGDDARTPNNDGATPVWIAPQNGRTATVRALVQEYGDSTADNDVWLLD